jgi:hypothetical protein
VALIGEPRVLSRAIDLIRFASDISPYRTAPRWSCYDHHLRRSSLTMDSGDPETEGKFSELAPALAEGLMEIKREIEADIHREPAQGSRGT